MAAGSPGPDAHLRARRWDAVVLGSALPGWVCAVRLAMARQRVLLVEEEAAARTPAAWREPFLLPGDARSGLWASCLQALGVPPIERRAFRPSPVAYQVLLPDARVDVGEPAATAEDLVAWGLAKPEDAHEGLRALAEAAEAEAEVLRSAPLLRRRGAGLRGAAAARGTPSAPRHARGLPSALSTAGPRLRALLEAPVRALGTLGSAEPGPEARARLLGGALEGAALPPEGGGLRAALRRRLEALHGAVRTVRGPLELAQLRGEPGIARGDTDELWLGRLLVWNAPEGRLAEALRSWERPVPRLLEGAAPPSHRRVGLHLRAERAALPEGLAERALLVPDPDAPVRGTNAAALALHPSPQRPGEVEIALSAVVEDAPGAEAAAREALEAELRALCPFAGAALERLPDPPRPLWDDEDARADPAPGEGWPAEVSIRAGGRLPVYRLPRPAVGALGLEGELVLGARAGDALARELA